MIALIPARQRSARIPGKALRRLGGVPLIAYAIGTAIESGLFEDVQIWTDDPAIHEWAAEHVSARSYPRAPSTWDEPDARWMTTWAEAFPDRAFALLRPTAPFRTVDTLRRAKRLFDTPDGTHDSLRAVQLVREHPGKMWTWRGPSYPMVPLLDRRHPDGTPWHSSPTQTLPPVYTQNACLEMGYAANLRQYGTIHGRKVIPFFTEGYEGHDLNTEDDWAEAKRLLAAGRVTLPAVAQSLARPLSPIP